MKDGNCGDDRRLCEKCFGVVIMRNEIQIAKMVVKIAEFQFQSLTFKSRAYCDQASVSEAFAYK